MKRLEYDWQLDLLEAGDEVGFVIGDKGYLPSAQATYRGRIERGTCLLFDGPIRDGMQNIVRFHIYERNISSLIGGRIKLRERCAIPYEELVE